MGFVGAFRPDDPSRSDDTYYRLAFGMTILTNLMLMALTGTFSLLACHVSLPTTLISLAAGRIWWIRRDVVAVIEPSVTRTYDTVIAMMYDDTLYGFSLCMTNSRSVL
jgi:hypothetical protein